MAETRGTDGVVKFQATANPDGSAISDSMTAVLHVTSFSLTEQTETIDVTSMGDSSRSIIASFQNFNGSVDGYWDTADTNLGHDADTDPVVKAGHTISFELYPGGDAGSDAIYYNGSAIVTEVTRTASFDGAVQYSLSFEGTGALGFVAEDDS